MTENEDVLFSCVDGNTPIHYISHSFRVYENTGGNHVRHGLPVVTEMEDHCRSFHADACD